MSLFGPYKNNLDNNAYTHVFLETWTLRRKQQQRVLPNLKYNDTGCRAGRGQGNFNVFERMHEGLLRVKYMKANR